ncbi:Macrolide export ATP-binding/permease protein MacB [Hartmannibacter diazotrophicus]|uniref:Macrolide export ATP-binding/permease protein MacB n=1 Tax=Hartmannibacter diazotrophicus TaxID=1482074 RepID=A0A2C9DD81_9HYPH|nr:ABC transporter permease [Hartmannibacter diazotrophicus]SON58068.1 Macrolide export ATP-binding/permease protein MacB [Hartmannibacter diazotrophicus]
MASLRSGAGRSDRPSFWLAARFAARELRGGLSGFVIFVACIAIGVAAIASVGATTRAITEGLSAEGATIVGGDLSFRLVQRPLDAKERGFLQTFGEVSEIASLRAMARIPDGQPNAGNSALVDVKAVDGAYPLKGTMLLDGGGTLVEALRHRGESYGIVVDPLLLARLDLAAGDMITIGKASFRIADTIAKEPDRVGTGIDFGPRVMMSRQALDATGLIQPGSLVRYSARLELPGTVSDEAVHAVEDKAKEAFPEAGWRIQTRDNATRGFDRDVGRFAQFLTLVGLTALLVGGVGVTNAVKTFLDRKRDEIATMKALGAPGGFVVAIYLMQILAITLVGVAIGLVLGAIAPFAGGGFIANTLKLPIVFGFYPLELALAALYGLLTAVAFALLTLGRAHDLPVSALFRDRVAPGRAWPRTVYLVATLAVALSLAGLAILLAYDRRVAGVFVAASAGAFLLLYVVAQGVMTLARRAPSPRSTGLRLAVRNIHRPGGLTVSVILSLGLGLALLVTLALIDGNLRRQLTEAIPERAPAFFFLDIQSTEAAAFDALVKSTVPDVTIERVPMMRGRITALKGVSTTKIEPPADARWALEGDRGITYSDTLPKASTLADGKWWPADYSGEPLVSFEDELAKALDLKIGDTVTVNVFGREVTAKIANTRHVDWDSLSINFVMVFSPNTFAGAPHSELATTTFPKGASEADETRLMKAVVADMPTVTVVRVKEVLDAVNSIMRQLALAVRAAASIALVSSVLVLAGALAAGHRQRIYDAVILKTFGASRGRILAAYGAEYLLLGLAAAVFGVIAGSLAAFGVLEGMMRIDMVFEPVVAVGAALVALVLTIGLGLLGSWRILGKKAAPVLRNL